MADYVAMNLFILI